MGLERNRLTVQRIEILGVQVKRSFDPLLQIDALERSFHQTAHEERLTKLALTAKS